MSDDILKKIQELNPLNNKIDFGFGSLLWQIDPKLNITMEALSNPLVLFNQIGDSKIMLHFTEQIKEKDIQIDFYVDGKAEVFTKGVTKDNLNFEFNIKKEIPEQEITISLNVKGNPITLVSQKGESSFKMFLGFEKKF
jgi:hypothetical protein